MTNLLMFVVSGQGPGHGRPEAGGVLAVKGHARRAVRVPVRAHLLRLHTAAARGATAVGPLLRLWCAPEHCVHCCAAGAHARHHSSESKVSKSNRL